MTEIRLSLSPTGGIRLHTGRGRTLDIPMTFKERIECECCGERYVASIEAQPLRILKRILQDAESGKRDQPGYIAEFPTQAVIDAWSKKDKKDKEEAARKRAAQKAAEEKAAWAAQGIDLGKMEFKL